MTLPVCGWTDVDFPRLTVAFHSVGYADAVTEETIAWHHSANHSGQHRVRM